MTNQQTAEAALDSDLRDEIISYLKKSRKESQPSFPTEYAALMYVALGTLKLLHESTMQYNEVSAKSGQGQITLHYPGALQEIIELLRAIPVEPSMIHIPKMQ